MLLRALPPPNEKEEEEEEGSGAAAAPAQPLAGCSVGINTEICTPSRRAPRPCLLPHTTLRSWMWWGSKRC